MRTPIPTPYKIEDTADVDCAMAVFCFPNTPSWRAVVRGLVSHLQRGWYWEETSKNDKLAVKSIVALGNQIYEDLCIMDCNFLKTLWKYDLATKGVGNGMVYPDAWYTDPQNLVTAQNPNPAPIKVASVMAGEYSGTRLTQADILKAISEKAYPDAPNYQPIVEAINGLELACPAITIDAPNYQPIVDKLQDLINKPAPNLQPVVEAINGLDLACPAVNIPEPNYQPIVEAINGLEFTCPDVTVPTAGIEAKLQAIAEKANPDLQPLVNAIKDLNLADPQVADLLKHVVATLSDGKVHPKEFYTAPTGTDTKKVDSVFIKDGIDLGTGLMDVSIADTLSDATYTHILPTPATPFITTPQLTANKLENIDLALRTVVAQISEHGILSAKLPEGAHLTVPAAIPLIGGQPIRNMDGNLIPYTWTYNPITKEPVSALAPWIPAVGGMPDITGAIAPPQVKPTSAFLYKRFKEGAADETLASILVESLRAGVKEPNSVGKMFAVGGSYGKGIADMLATGEDVTEPGWLDNIFGSTTKPEGVGELLTRALTLKDNGKDSISLVKAFFYDNDGTPKSLATIDEQIRLILEKLKLIGDKENILDTVIAILDSVKMGKEVTNPLTDILTGQLADVPAGLIDLLKNMALTKVPEGTSIGSTPVVVRNEFSPVLRLTEDAIELNTTEIVTQLKAIADKPAPTFSTAGIVAQLQVIAEKPPLSTAGIETQLRAIAEKPATVLNLDKMEASIKLVADAIAACCCNEPTPPAPAPDEPRYPQPTAPYEGKPEPNPDNPDVPYIPIIEPAPPAGYGERRTDDDLCKAITLGVHLILDFLSTYLNIMEWANIFLGKFGIKKLVTYLSDLKWVRALVLFFVVIDAEAPFTELTAGGIILSIWIEWVVNALISLTIEGLQLLVAWLKQNEKKIICLLYNATSTNEAVQQVLDLLDNDEDFNPIYKSAAKGVLNMMLYNPVIYAMYFGTQVSLADVVADCSGCCLRWDNVHYITRPTGTLIQDGSVQTLTSGSVAPKGVPPYHLGFETNCANCGGFNVEIISISASDMDSAHGGGVMGCNNILQCRYNRGQVTNNDREPSLPNPYDVTNYYGNYTNVQWVKIDLNVPFTVTVRIY